MPFYGSGQFLACEISECVHAATYSCSTSALSASTASLYCASCNCFCAACSLASNVSSSSRGGSGAVAEEVGGVFVIGSTN